MQNRFTARGKNKEEQDLLLAFELQEAQFKVILHLIPMNTLKQDQIAFLEKDWVEGAEYSLLENTQTISPDLNDDSMLPQDILSQETGKIRMQQNAWALRLLTNKLWESYLLELEELKKRAKELVNYDRNLFDQAKSFWERVLERRKERDISQEKLEEIKNEVNGIFEALKNFRKSENQLFDKESAEKRAELLGRLQQFREQISADTNFKQLFEDLKKLQDSIKDGRFSKADFQLIRKAFDDAFRFLQLKRDDFYSNKNQDRIRGLNDALQKIEKSLERDKKDIEYFSRKIESPKVNQLEAQLIKVKLNLLKDTAASKEEKLADIRKTLNKLSRQMEKQATVPAAVNEDSAEHTTVAPSESALPEKQEEKENSPAEE
jgi:hypothetical protein